MSKVNEEKKGTTQELRDHLYNQIAKLNDPAADLDKELKKANALTSIGPVIINSIKAETDFRRQLTIEEKLEQEKNKPKRLGDGKNKG